MHSLLTLLYAIDTEYVRPLDGILSSLYDIC